MRSNSRNGDAVGDRVEDRVLKVSALSRRVVGDAEAVVHAGLGAERQCAGEGGRADALAHRAVKGFEAGRPRRQELHHGHRLAVDGVPEPGLDRRLLPARHRRRRVRNVLLDEPAVRAPHLVIVFRLGVGLLRRLGLQHLLPLLVVLVLLLGVYKGI